MRQVERRPVARKKTCPLVSLTVIKCPQPKTLDSCTIIQDLQPLYHFKDRFTATCKEGYQLMEVRPRAEGGFWSKSHAQAQSRW